jgi:hypothetical protein
MSIFLKKDGSNSGQLTQFAPAPNKNVYIEFHVWSIRKSSNNAELVSSQDLLFGAAQFMGELPPFWISGAAASH